MITNSMKEIILLPRNRAYEEIRVKIRPYITFKEIGELIGKKMGLSDSTTLRIFTKQGVEVAEREIWLLNDQEIVFASRGEEFDPQWSLDMYKEIEVLGKGGFGKVILAEERQTGDRVAIKFLDSAKINSANSVELLFNEGQMLKNLIHRNIVKIINCFVFKNMEAAVVMEYLDGGEIGKYLQSKGKLDEDEAKFLFEQIVEAVAFCHSRNVIHRDLKLENILLASKDSKIIKIVDFGIATMRSDASEAGTLRYIPPEILTGLNKIPNPAIDIWSMGCILYAFIHGRLPFEGLRTEVIEKIKNLDYQISPSVQKEYSPECIDLIKKLLTKNYKTRITMLDIINHPWMTGEKLPDLGDSTYTQPKTIVIQNENKTQKPKPSFKKTDPSDEKFEKFIHHRFKKTMTFSPNIKEKKISSGYKERLSLSIDKRKLESESMIRKPSLDMKIVLLNGISSKSKRSVLLDDDYSRKK